MVFEEDAEKEMQIGVVRMLCERRLELDNEVFICFVDFEKAFDGANWVKTMDIL